MNVFSTPSERSDEEQVDVLLDGATRIERIVSTGQHSPAGFWYDQTQDEWVCVLTGWGELEYPDGTMRRLCVGDTAFLPAHMRHRVHATSETPACIWLCVFRPAL